MQSKTTKGCHLIKLYELRKKDSILEDDEKNKTKQFEDWFGIFSALKTDTGVAHQSNLLSWR